MSNRRDRQLGPVELLVCGAGMAGLCAAASAVEVGIAPLVVEKGDQPGGSMRLSGGSIWTAPSMDVMRRWVPAGDRRRQRQLVVALRPGLAWLAGLGIELRRPVDNARQVGAEVDVVQLTDRLVAAVERGGGRFSYGLALSELARHADGRWLVSLRDRGGAEKKLLARAVILATGGFQGNRELLRRHVAAAAERMLLRANPWSSGDALLAGLAVGARLSPALGSFYGHSMPAEPADVPAAGWTSVTQYYSQDAALVNDLGRRFFDETRSMADEVAANEIVRQPRARAWLVMDRRIHDDLPLEGRSDQRVGPLFANATRAGAPAVVAGSLAELADGLGRWGVDAAAFRSTVDEFNRALAAGRGGELAVPRRGSPFGLLEPPFRALAVRPGITFTMGGLDVDTQLRLLDRDGRALPGLYAAGVDAGGTYEGGYMGGLVLGLVQGRRAGRGAARNAAGGGA